MDFQPAMEDFDPHDLYNTRCDTGAFKLFSADAFDFSEEMYSHLQWQRRGWSGTKDPKIHDMVLNMQKGVLDQLLHQNVLKRISDTEPVSYTHLTLPTKA